MLLEYVLHEKYIEYLKHNNMPFEHEAQILNGIIDFKVDIGEKSIGVEVKADRSNLFSALGQLMNIKRTFSDVYLLSTEDFYQTIYTILVEFGIQDKFGFIVLKNGKFITMSKPKTKEYYFNEKFYHPPLKTKTRTLVLDEQTIKFLEKHKCYPFICSDVAKELNIRMGLAQNRISSWKRFGLIENEPHLGLPKPFKVIKIPKEEHVYV